MPNIRSSADLRNQYGDSSAKQRMDRLDLYCKLMDGIRDMQAGKTRPFSEAMAEIRATKNRRYNN